VAKLPYTPADVHVENIPQLAIHKLSHDCVQPALSSRLPFLS